MGVRAGKRRVGVEPLAREVARNEHRILGVLAQRNQKDRGNVRRRSFGDDPLVGPLAPRPVGSSVLHFFFAGKSSLALAHLIVLHLDE